MHCHEKLNVKQLKKLIETYKLLDNNNLDFAICLSGLGMSIIDLVLINLELSPYGIWEIFVKQLT